VTAVRISEEKPDLSPVLGELDKAQAEGLTAQLATADEALAGLIETLDERGGNGFHSDGVVLEQEVSGQAQIRILLEDAKGAVGFAAELRPGNFFGDERNPWQPGHPPMVMETDAWHVAGEVSVRFKTRVAGRPYTIQEQVLEIEEERFETPAAAVAAFAALCERLAQLALSREPTLGGWKPDVPESVGGPPIA
jgi:hypothetical protein